MRDIPGFYYDTEKKKYFKITKDHLQSKKRNVARPNIEKKEVYIYIYIQFKFFNNKIELLGNI